MAKIDLHIHSKYSDGSDSIPELMKNINRAGLEIFSLTDHDTIDGCLEMEKFVPPGIKFIRGIELTCTARGQKCHILGYNYNPKDHGLERLTEKGKVLRRTKLEKRIELLREVHGINLTREELDWLYSRRSVVKMHIANILVARGLSDNNVDAMTKYLDGCKTGNSRFDGEEAIRVIIAAGGTPIWAHPLGGEGERHLTQEEFLPKLKTLIDCGIKGMECYYSRYSADESDFLVKCARENNLFITGGSDYHGKNKNVALGTLNKDFIPVDSDKLYLLCI